MNEKFSAAVKNHNMISSGDSVAVGVSGGADSMCLLDILYEHKDELGITLKAAHVNHCLRGDESDSDEAFVRAYCEKRGIPLSVLRADINSLSDETKESTELCARRVRYEFFDSLGCTKTATAHTGSDSAETMLMNLSRGTGLNGLCGIPPVRGNVIRPLIYFTREETESYCREHDIDYVTDSSNLSDDYTRNKIRHKVAGALKEINPAFENNALRCISSLREDNDFLNEYAKDVYDKLLVPDGLDLAGLKNYHAAVKSRVIALYFSDNSSSDFEKRHVSLIEDNIMQASFAVVLPGGERACIKNGVLFIDHGQRNCFSPDSISVSKYDDAEVDFCGSTLMFSVCDRRKLMPDEFAVDFSEIDDIITIRSRKEGDSLSLSGRHCTKSLKKLFNEMKIPVSERSAVPVVCDKNGVIWCAAGGTDSSRALNKNTDKFLIIKKECGKNDK